MADNYIIRDGAGNPLTFKSKEISPGLHTPQSIPTDASGAAFSNTNPLPTKQIPIANTLVNRSGVCDGNANQISPANASRRGFFLQNISSIGDIWLNIFGVDPIADTPGNILIPPLGMYEMAPHMVSGAALKVLGISGVEYTAGEC